MTNKEKWMTVLVCFVLLFLLTMLGAWKKADYAGNRAAGNYNEHGADSGDELPEDEAVLSADDLKGKRLGGVTGRMPDNSAKIFFESMLGRKLSGYTGYGSIDECLYALHSGGVDAIWACDVTADYLMKCDERLAVLDSAQLAAIENTSEPRFSFGMAAVNDDNGQKLVEELNQAIEYLRADGTLERLENEYISGACEAEKLSSSDMVVNDDVHRIYYYSTEPITVAVTGAVAPLELIDESGKPYGYCVALMDEIGQVLQRGVRFVVLDPETAFTGLMSGRADVIFAYGSGKITTEGTKVWCVTGGYCDMQKYEFLYLK